MDIDLNPFLDSLAVVLVAVVSGFVTWMIARRTKSGHIDTSEAATLWTEGTMMRKELRDQVTLLRKQLAEAITAISDLNDEIRRSRNETLAAREETRLSREETRQLMVQINAVHGEIKTSNALTIGALADNTETRRILEIPKKDRTPVENEHVATVSQRLPETEHPMIPEADKKVSDAK